jgi:hypothetical protein
MHKITMSFSEIAERLNKNGFRTSYGTTYSEGRGTVRMTSSLYRKAAKAGKKDLPEAITIAFVGKNGAYADENYD